MKVIIMRGLPGAGKSTFVDKLKGNVSICSADNYHVKDGVYRFDPRNIGAAHNTCLKKFLDRISLHPTDQPNYLIVDNTNTTAWEIAPYYRLAEMFGVEVTIVRVICDFATSVKRNIHGVPASQIWKMFQNLNETLPTHWKEEFVFAEESKA